jgi:hypothetical protein
VVRARKIPLPHLRLLVAAGARARAASNVLFDRRPRFSRCRWSRSRRGRIRCLGVPRTGDQRPAVRELFRSFARTTTWTRRFNRSNLSGGGLVWVEFRGNLQGP